MSRFIKVASASGTVSEALTLSDITQGFTNIYASQTSGSFSFPPATTKAKIVAIGGGGGGAANNGSSYLTVGRAGGGGGGTVIAYIDTKLTPQISWTIGTAGCTCVFNGTCGCVNCGTAGGNTVVSNASGSSLSITACGGGPGIAYTYGCQVVSGSGGSGTASGTLCCFIYDGRPGGAHATWWCSMVYCNIGGVYIEGGSTYLGRGAMANGQSCSGNYYALCSCATYGGGGMGGGCVTYTSCSYLPAVQPASGLVFLEYN